MLKFLVGYFYYALRSFCSPLNINNYLQLAQFLERQGRMEWAYSVLDRAIFGKNLSSVWLHNNFAWYAWQIVKAGEVDEATQDYLLKIANKYFSEGLEIDSKLVNLRNNHREFIDFCQSQGIDLDYLARGIRSKSEIEADLKKWKLEIPDLKVTGMDATEELKIEGKIKNPHNQTAWKVDILMKFFQIIDGRMEKVFSKQMSIQTVNLPPGGESLFSLSSVNHPQWQRYAVGISFWDNQPGGPDSHLVVIVGGKPAYAKQTAPQAFDHGLMPGFVKDDNYLLLKVLIGLIITLLPIGLAIFLFL